MEHGDLTRALCAPFEPDAVGFLPRSTSGDQALGIPHIESRDVMRRLDGTVGPLEWAFEWDLIPGERVAVKGRLTVMGVTKADVGEAAREDEPLKAAVSDALKRCAVHFGIGRYLYYLPPIWAPYDASRKQFRQQPVIPAGALERAVTLAMGVAPQPAAAPPRETPRSAPRREPQPDQAAITAAPDAVATARKAFFALLRETMPDLTESLPRRAVMAVLLQLEWPVTDEQVAAWDAAVWTTALRTLRNRCRPAEGAARLMARAQELLGAS